MPRSFQLTNGQTARVRIQHDACVHDGDVRRGTRVKLTVGTRTFSARAICHENDNFSRKLGRKYAVSRLLDRIRRGEINIQMNQEDRCRVFAAVCPEYKPKVRRHKIGA